MFEPIAIVGRGCVLPGALTPDALWQAVAAGRDGITPAPAGSWGLDAARVLAGGPSAEGSCTDRGGYVSGFEQVFDPQGFLLASERIEALDPLFRWLLYCAREALREIGLAHLEGLRADVLIGNLSYPTRSFADFAQGVWLQQQDIACDPPRAAPENRFSSGYPAHLVARALGAGGKAFALDAACASSLYALKLACDRLQDRDADLVLAGAVNHADDLFLHMGFTALQALSPSGRSRPFHRAADGLLPAEGAAVVALKRLADAEAAGDRIHGVIRGIGLSNDGRKGGFLAPDADGQVRAMRAAYAMSGIEPSSVSLLECHATGTAVGDAIELRSSAQVFADTPSLPIGSLKSNFGHLITASGVAGLLKVMGAFAHGQRPPTLHADDPTPALEATPLRPLLRAEDWDVAGPRRAAVNNFGFGGNNAHLIVEQWQATPSRVFVQERPPVAIAICGIGVVAGPCHGKQAFAERLFVPDAAKPTPTDSVLLPLSGLRFPPSDLRQALAQQTLMLEAALEAAAAIGPVAQDRAGIVVGMGCDPEGCRPGLRWRLADLVAAGKGGQQPDAAWLTAAKDAAYGPLGAADALGCMPNVPANRLNLQFDWQAFGFTVSGEELSGLDGLWVASRALRHGEIDAALVGAVDLSCEPVHEAAAATVLPADRQHAGDAAVALVLKRLDDAREQGDRVYAILPEEPSSTDRSLELSLGTGASLVTEKFGHAHAASGLLHVAAAALACASAARPPANGGRAAPWIQAQRSAVVEVRSFSGQRDSVVLAADDQTPARSFAANPVPLVRVYAGADRSAVARNLREGIEDGKGPARLAIVAADPEQLAERSKQALALLGDASEVAGEGIHYRDRPIEGELAFVFTGAAAAYPGMGRELMLALPELGQQLAQRHAVVGPVADDLYAADPEEPLGAFDQLKGSALLCQVHALLARGILGLRPQAAMGLSSGETNALFAFDAWRDMDAMFADIDRAGIYGRELTGACRAAAQAWGLPEGAPVAWRNWRLLAPIEAVEAAIADEPRATITIINAPDDCVIGGDAEACQRVLRQIGRSRAIELGQDMVVHCPEMQSCAALWRQIHDRETHPVEGVRFYTNATNTHYRPDRSSAAAALLGQALQAIDFRHTALAAWRDGVRIFVELGPRNALSRAIERTLEGREHLALAMDRPGPGGMHHLFALAAKLIVAGVEVDLEALRSRLPANAGAGPRMLRLEAHPPPIRFPALPQDIDVSDIETMPPAPPLPPVAGQRPHAVAAPALALASIPQQIAAAVPATATGARSAAPAADSPILRILAQTAGMHRSFVEDQTRLHRQFLGLQQASVPSPGATVAALPQRPQVTAESRTAPRPDGPPVSPPPAVSIPAALPEPASSPTFSRADLEVLASGRISQVFGPQFKAQDAYHRQVRMPEPPLLLVDRVTAIEGEPGSMGKGTVWTETDIPLDAWYLHHGRVSPGVLIESGQADLLLISWLGVDALNKGERVYRLLGCELTFHDGGMPSPGDTLRYDIHVDGHAKTGDVRLFFFHYDCRVGDRTVLSVRDGQAGFFTDQELAGSGGVLWSAETDPPKPDAQLDPLPGCTTRRSFSREQVEALVAGNAYACFGEGFEMAASHQRTPSPPSGRMHLIEEVSAFDPSGGPWGRGYLRAEATVTPDHWFYDGHFKNDPCMPGTLMADAAVQALGFTMAAQGFTVTRDGWRFEPVPGEAFKFLCRGQVVPDGEHLLTYEIFVEEVIDGPEPVVYAALLCSSDGFKVFQCRRFGLKLVPDWPLGDRGELLAEAGPPRPLRAGSDVRGDYGALLACAWGAPSEAFGTMYARFDRGRVPRLPGPPYHFISRIAAIDYPPGEVTNGATVEAEYDVPTDAWYFAENGYRVMPFGILMEVLLQPCGWLASSLGFALASADELCFRNLDGDDARPLREVLPTSGTLRVKTTLTRCSRAGQMALVFFRVTCRCDDGPVLDLNTSFGFFDPAALRNQVGLPADEEARAQRDEPSDVMLDLALRPDSLYGRHARIAGGRLRMIDVITGYWPGGGAAGLGRIRGRQRINPESWYFKAHFYQDPVQPGSLGIEALLQLLQAFMLLHGLDAEIDRARFQAVALDEPLVWKYRGQVVPTNREVTTELEITRIEHTPSEALAVAKGSLWVDGLRIYAVENLAMRLVAEPKGVHPSGASDSTVRADIVLDPAVDTWIGDHRPTYTTPALAMTQIVEYLAAATQAAAPTRLVVALEDVVVQAWVTVAAPVRLATEVKRLDDDLFEANLLLLASSGARRVASGRVRLASTYPSPPPPLPALTGADVIPDPYATGTLPHGKAFQILRTLRRDRTGASCQLDAGAVGAPVGLLNPILLDGALHGIPHDAPSLWFEGIATDRISYPQRIERITFHGPTPTDGMVRGEVRAAGMDTAGLQPRFRSQLVVGDQVWAAIEHAEVLVPKGPIGMAAPADRRAFVRDRQYVPDMGLSQLVDGATQIANMDVVDSNWLPGALEAVYQVEGRMPDIVRAIAIKEHVARKVEIHPSQIQITGEEATSPTLPLTAFPFQVERQGTGVTVTDAGPERLDLAPVTDFWRHRLNIAEGPVEQIYIAAIRRFLRRLIVTDPHGLDQVRGQPVMFLGNHQVMLETLLFVMTAAAVNQRPIVTIAKQEHRETWAGRLLRISETYPGVTSHRSLLFFDRDDKASMLTLMRDVKHIIKDEGLSLMVHAEGTRALQCRQPVSQVSGVLLDLAMAAHLPIVPMRFAGGLPVEAASSRLDFPLGCARQDIYLGAPIAPEDLARLPLAERKQHVLEAMNALGPDLMTETPNAPDAAFADEVALLMRTLGIGEPQATVLHALRQDDLCCALREVVAALLAGTVPAGEGPEAEWLRSLATWFRTPS